ncbi:zinc ribbon domain-containing protein [Brevibacterium sp. BDJS002]|uniref:FmdB family transcriptional regulator n=1 Tax=Brevibacterium aurantiacum TaxID=273384 RepID=A0A2A3YT14_BREAU|nr:MULTISPECIES: FmdB family zinc ribbon protein [Brevibacterium]MDN5549670.1 FmdB family transcriptional regulator [Brevibacterium sp.]AZL06844.1 FmdB family transcriptional regulator [Brevibacterium aurantiacum]AZL14071.1 FmdB family transcriptional regulator [Brevibacterium aurantiacum]AZT94608.1 FmdB family transcriptional regulator [Brevibacterium aurantiacum]AZT98393.1 FmdB family transcriptional regulator [Brevibacterium aurantiacum]
MPVYSYACKSCGHAFDIHQDFSDDSLTVCPECQGRLKKVFGTVGISFKGSGFYATDSRASNSSTVPSSSSSSNSDSSSSSSKESSSSSDSSSKTSSSPAKSAAASSSASSD